MFPLSNPEIQLDMYRQRADELHRTADAYRIARAARRAGRHTRRGRTVRAPNAR
jgi:hypothetical protein